MCFDVQSAGGDAVILRAGSGTTRRILRDTIHRDFIGLNRFDEPGADHSDRFATLASVFVSERLGDATEYCLRIR